MRPPGRTALNKEKLMSLNPPDSRLADSPSVRIGEDTRAAFIGRTYLHLFGAIVAFVLIEVWLFSSGLAEPIARSMMSVSWLLVLGGFMVVSWIASRAAATARSSAA
jgi:FtsH-binding integral membrane protein